MADPDELAKAHAENFALRRIVGEQSAMIAQLHEMLLVAQRAASASIAEQADKAIEKARAK